MQDAGPGGAVSAGLWRSFAGFWRSFAGFWRVSLHLRRSKCGSVAQQSPFGAHLGHIKILLGNSGTSLKGSRTLLRVFCVSLGDCSFYIFHLKSLAQIS